MEDHVTYSNGLTQTATGGPQTPDSPDPEVRKNTRRRYTPKFKLRILKQADAMEPGEAAALFRKEGIYASMVRRWRDERLNGSLGSLEAPTEEPEVRKETLALQRRVSQLEKKLEKADTILEVQKKLLLLFDWPGEGTPSR